MSTDELATLGRSLERLAVDLLHALRDGVVTVDELVRLGCDVPAVVAQRGQTVGAKTATELAFIKAATHGPPPPPPA